MDAKIVIGYFVVGTIWGVTNALMEQGSIEENKSNE